MTTITSSKSLADEAAQVLRAITLIKLGARMQVLESEFPKLSRDRLIRLYREVKGASPPKGMLPFSEDWYLTWGPNIHASMFANVYAFLEQNSKDLDRVDLLSRAYALYAEHFTMNGEALQMDLTRAWTFVRFKDAGILRLAGCTRCRGKFVAHAHEPAHGMVCGLCQPPSRAGKTKAKAAREQSAALQQAA
ncbi:flagellar transcriptional regulator FlhC [Caballeronia sp. LZ062]|uniref:flagellar transcriptional regulator FlhC n=1 Tax=unclassified Caballeronia TaxID=2646786 RepID=UPI0028597C70|nr:MULTISPECIES: flagellar transcriptional regulator FlhC [unclassified Caballeronia]MDR5856060.1 flagellar transcriptional regulator FlhC [Caballeronia sp. LZ050]MDR5872731.1 flagellar transcriptional regulator FlhC [Caballeronia sp. LZ062]